MLKFITIFAPLLGMLGWTILATIFMLLSLRDGSLQRTDKQGLLGFRRRIVGRIGMAMISAFPLGFLLLSVIHGLDLINAVLHHHPVSNSYLAFFTLPFGILLGGTLGGMFLYAAGPCDICLNLDRHTYQFVCGWPIQPRMQVGSWEDIAGVFVRVSNDGRNRRQFRIYSVEIAWRRERKRCPQLGIFGSERAAKALADEMASMLGLPRVTAPPLGKTAVDPIRQVLPSAEASPQPLRPFRPLFPP